MTQTPVAEGLFTVPSGPDEQPALIASERDGRLSFPPRPGGTPYLLKRRGTLWSFTSQNFRPPVPYDGDDTVETFKPYLVGYVELEGELIVEGRLTDCTIDQLELGLPMELRLVPYTTRPDGTEILTYAFAPVSGDEEVAR
jgi:uncharacterized OB-fold protein